MKFIILFFLFNITLCFAQFGTEQIVSTDTSLPIVIVVGDINGDKHPDIVAGSRSFNEVAWFKNLDGFGTFGPLQQITSPPDELRGINLGDIDGDGDLDVLIANSFLGAFYWHENLDGLGNFGILNSIDENADGAFDIVLADLDGDDDLDLVGAISQESTVAWYENLDGVGNFGSRNIISNTVLGTRSVFVTDIDGDGDKDVVVGSGDQVTISWYENIDGQGTFGAQNIVAGEALFVADVFCVDIDGDSDLDIVGTINAEGKVAWHENLNGLGDFGPQRFITNEALGCTSIYCADLDNDGDNDVLYSSTPDSTIENSELAWSENIDGLGNFSQKKVIGNKLQLTRGVFAADADGDGDIDVFATSQNNNKIVWYENLTILGVGDIKLQEFKVYPNPANNTLLLEYPNIISLRKIQLNNLQGQVIIQKNTAVKVLNISAVKSGLYFLKLETSEGEIFVEKIIIE